MAHLRTAAHVPLATGVLDKTAGQPPVLAVVPPDTFATRVPVVQPKMHARTCIFNIIRPSFLNCSVSLLTQKYTYTENVCHARAGYFCPSCSSSGTTNSCPTGSYCPQLSSSSTLCPAGKFGSTLRLTTSSCSGLCTYGPLFLFLPDRSLPAMVGMK
jgi:hypothetical protein